jgi:hypothetical protein
VVQTALDQFYKRRLERLNQLKISQILQRKNPYLYRAMGIAEPQQLVKALVSAYLSSSDEGVFGDALFEPIAIGISGGRKSITDSVDFELEVEGVTRAYAVKSGLSVFNAQSRRRQIQAFEECRRRLPGRAFEAVVGYGYGKRATPPRGNKNFREVSGQAFWEEISGDPDLYKKIFDLLAIQADLQEEPYGKVFADAMNRFVEEFQHEFATPDGKIDWNKVLTCNSGKKAPKQPRKSKSKVEAQE